MSGNALWVVGTTRSGKTTRLIHQFVEGAEPSTMRVQPTQPERTGVWRSLTLVFAATGDTRIDLADRLADASNGKIPFDSTTPLGFFQDEVILFWPLLAQALELKVQYPLRLRPETEQELATRLWQPLLDDGILALEGVTDYYLVRRSLDLLQLAASAGVPPEDIPVILRDGLELTDGSTTIWEVLGQALMQWRQWCLERGLLTYSLVTELYWRYLLPHPTYQARLLERYQRLLADDVDEYPAIAHQLFSLFLDHNRAALFTCNPRGAVRLGLGADPQALETLATRCQVEILPVPNGTLGTEWGETIPLWVNEPGLMPPLPSSFQLIQTTSRAQLLRQTSEVIIEAVQRDGVPPEEIAVIGPGLDAIARYTLWKILTDRGIPVESLSDQRPLASSPLVRALLTLMSLVYSGLGRLLDRETVSEMLVVLSQPPHVPMGTSGVELARIDPVRAGLITDHCFMPHPDHPRLLPVTSFPRWDRLGHQASYSYGELVQWVETQQNQLQQRLIPNPVVLLDRAIQRFLFGGSHLPYDQVAALRELMETAQHYWDMDARLRQIDPAPHPVSATVEQFIHLLRSGTITADPYPVRPIGPSSKAVTLATIFQYRSARRCHRWQFWLDAGSALWLTGGGALYGAPLFLHEWSGRPWTAVDALEADRQRLQRQLQDLLYRAGERIYFCHSDLATNGQEQGGSLLSLINAAAPVVAIATVEE